MVSSKNDSDQGQEKSHFCYDYRSYSSTDENIIAASAIVFGYLKIGVYHFRMLNYCIQENYFMLYFTGNES